MSVKFFRMFSITNLIINPLGFMVKGAFKVLGGLISIGTSIIKASFTVVSKGIGFLLGISGKIYDGIGRLVEKTPQKVKQLLFTPAGFYMMGFVSGFVFEKIRGFYNDHIKEKMENMVQKTQDFLIKNFVENNKLKKMVKVLSGFDLNEFKHFIYRKYYVFKDFLLKSADASIGGLIGSTTGGALGWIGKKIFKALIGSNPVSGAIGGLISGIFTVGGELIGCGFSKIREDDKLNKQNILNDIIRDNLIKNRKKSTGAELEYINDRLNNDFKGFERKSDDEKKKMSMEELTRYEEWEALQRKKEIAEKGYFASWEYETEKERQQNADKLKKIGERISKENSLDDKTIFSDPFGTSVKELFEDNESLNSITDKYGD